MNHYQIWKEDICENHWKKKTESEIRSLLIHTIKDNFLEGFNILKKDYSFEIGLLKY